MSTPRDSQKSKLYKWETAFHRQHIGPNETKLTYEDAEIFVKKVCESEGLPPLSIKKGRRDSGVAYMSYSKKSIVLPPWASTHFTILHELAHHAANHKHGNEIAHHGPEFIYEFTSFLAKMFDIPQEEIIQHAKKHGLKCL